MRIRKRNENSFRSKIYLYLNLVSVATYLLWQGTFLNILLILIYFNIQEVNKVNTFVGYEKLICIHSSEILYILGDKFIKINKRFQNKYKCLLNFE